jgi:hypothetical protein
VAGGGSREGAEVSPPVARGSSECYSWQMLADAVYRLGVLLVTVALALWPAMDGSVRASMSVEASAVVYASVGSSETSSVPDGCRGSDFNDMSAAGCAAHCVMAAAIVPVATVVAAFPPLAQAPSATLGAEGRRQQPDPPPPRPVAIA